LGEPWPGHPELQSFEPQGGDAYFHLQTINGDPRVHVDLDVASVPTALAKLIDLGAGALEAQPEWQPMLSPGGLPFCLVPARPRQTPEPARWDDGHHSRLVQLCIDSPRAAHEAEVAFWRSALGPGRWAESQSREFAGKFHDDDGSPIQLLFQRLDEPEGPVRAHLDLGTDDREAEVARLVELGAEAIAPGRGWFALRDPLGLLFCVTDNSPSQTRRRDIG
jgi:hypothetical protein